MKKTHRRAKPPTRRGGQRPHAATESPSAARHPDDPLHAKRVVLCVTGGIAAYKAAYLTRLLVKCGARVIVVMSEAAQRFVAPLTFETLSGNPVVTSTFERAFEMGAVEHVDLAEWCDLVIVAPATYNCIGKLHAGVADDVVSTFLSAVTRPVFLAPAMNEHMWRNPIQQRNVRELRELGYHLVDPERGGLACSWEGEGRMSEPETILQAVSASLASAATPRRLTTQNGGGPTRDLAGRTLLVTAGGTREAIDPVRFLGNRSSGRMGYALAQRALRRGARVFLVSGPTTLPPPSGLAGFRVVESAAAMLEATREWLLQADLLVMAAAVADYRPAHPSSRKIKRDGRTRSLELEPTPDILAELRKLKGERTFVGFALETSAVDAEARRKLKRKGVDFLVANQVGPNTGTDSDTNQVWIYDAEGLIAETPVLDKDAIADIILDVVAVRRTQRRSRGRAEAR